VRGGAVVKMLSLLRAGNPRPSRHERSPWFLPAVAFPEVAPYVRYCLSDYDSCFGPDSSVG
jgi:hypothetical protein